MKQYTTGNRQWAFWLGGMAIGAAAMYLADPAQGKRRRTLMQEKMLDASNRTGDALNLAMRDTGNKLSAWQSQAKSLLSRGIQPVSNQLLEARVNTKLKKFCRYPEAINVRADQGCVTLTGSVMADERAKLIRKLYEVPGIVEIRDRLETSPSASYASDLEHGGRAVEQGKAATAHTAALLGGGIMGAARRLPVGSLLAVAGLGYLIRSLSKGDMKRILSGKSKPQARTINIQRSIEIQASPETVFDIWSRYEHFPQFMSHVIEVRDLGMQRSHWTVKGPAGVELEWNSVLTKCMPPTMLAWKSEPGSQVQHTGSVRFESSANGGTRATVRMTYSPAAGTLGQGIAALLGDDPAQQLEEDLLQMKHFIESRNLPRDISQPASSAGQILH